MPREARDRAGQGRLRPVEQDQVLRHSEGQKPQGAAEGGSSQAHAVEGAGRRHPVLARPNAKGRRPPTDAPKHKNDITTSDVVMATVPEPPTYEQISQLPIWLVSEKGTRRPLNGHDGAYDGD